LSATPRVDSDRPADSPDFLDSNAPVDSAPIPLSLFGFEFSLETASLDSLEEVTRSVTRKTVVEWFSRFGETEEVALLSTCHRVEILGVARHPVEVERWRRVLPGRPELWRMRGGSELISHLFRVAAGWESLARGEEEVRLQVRAAASRIESRHPRPVLRALLLEAARAADEVAPSAGSPPSIAAIATTRLLELVSPGRPHVVVVGAGTVGRQVVKNLACRAQVTVVYHRKPPEENFLREARARAVALEGIREAIGVADAIVTAAKFGNHGLGPADLPPDRPLVLVDLGMPRNIDPEVRALPGVRLVDLEELYRPTEPRAPSDPDDERLDALAHRCSERVGRLLLEPWVEAFRRAAEEVRCSELANARPFLGDLRSDQEHAIDLLTRRLVSRLLNPPTERVRSMPAGPDGDLRRRWAFDLLRPDSPDS
jgi:glutamyl-tRNA reductase